MHWMPEFTEHTRIYCQKSCNWIYYIFFLHRIIVQLSIHSWLLTLTEGLKWPLGWEGKCQLRILLYKGSSLNRKGIWHSPNTYVTSNANAFGIEAISTYLKKKKKKILDLTFSKNFIILSFLRSILPCWYLLFLFIQVT